MVSPFNEVAIIELLRKNDPPKSKKSQPAQTRSPESPTITTPLPIINDQNRFKVLSNHEETQNADSSSSEEGQKTHETAHHAKNKGKLS